MRTDWNYYNKLFENLKKKEPNNFSYFNSILKGIKEDKKCLKQQTYDLDELYDIGFLLNIKFQKVLYSTTKRSTGILVPSAVKNPKRCIEKICRHYNRDTTQLCDIIRASILFCSVDKCNGCCNKCKTLLTDQETEYEKDIVIKIKKSISVCDSFLDIQNSSPMNKKEDMLSSRSLEDTLDISNRGDQEVLEHLRNFKSKHRSSIFDDINLSCSFSNHVQKISGNINRVSSNSTDNAYESSFCSNMLSFIKELKDNKYLEVVKIKNRFDEKYNTRMSLGYRDVLINVKIRYVVETNRIRLMNNQEWKDDNNYIIAEIQLHSIDMYNYKVLKGHENYKRYRDIMSI